VTRPLVPVRFLGCSKNVSTAKWQRDGSMVTIRGQKLGRVRTNGCLAVAKKPGGGANPRLNLWIAAQSALTRGAN
jgi:hypothetical protein